MRTKECPSCAMDVDASAKEYPICQYEFAEIKNRLQVDCDTPDCGDAVVVDFLRKMPFYVMHQV